MSQRGPSYQSQDDWKRYLPFLPKWLRVLAQSSPREQWWPWRGAQIHLDWYDAAEAPLTVIVLHGAGGYGRLLAPFGAMIASLGYGVVLPDLPGYGLSRALLHLIHHDRWVECAADLVVRERQRSRRPVVLFGCSLGGFLAYLVAASGSPVAGVIATTLADPRLPAVQAQFARFRWLGTVAARTLPVLDAVAGGLRVPIKWVSNMAAIANDPQLAALLLQDRCGGGNQVPIRFMRSLFDATPAVEPEQFDRCPVLLAHPAADRWTTIEVSRLFFDRLAGAKELALLERCGHFPIEEPGVSQLRDAVAVFLARVAESSGRSAPPLAGLSRATL